MRWLNILTSHGRFVSEMYNSGLAKSMKGWQEFLEPFMERKGHIQEVRKIRDELQAKTELLKSLKPQDADNQPGGAE